MTEIPYITIPLFDWDDYPKSYAALTPGGGTTEFESNTWNAIVDKVKDAFTEAGIPWSVKYLSYEDTKITTGLKKLYAKQFNSVRDNIDTVIPFAWQWEVNGTFHGYIGRKDFRGYSDTKSIVAADKLYASYIKELARRLNVMLSILRGEFAYFKNVNCEFSIYAAGNASAKCVPAKYLEAEAHAATSTNAAAMTRLRAPLKADAVTRAAAKIVGRNGHASVGGVESQSAFSNDIDVTPRKIAGVARPNQIISGNLYSVSVERYRIPAPITFKGYISGQSRDATGRSGRVQPGVVNFYSKFTNSAVVGGGDATRAVTNAIAKTISEASTVRGEAADFESVPQIAYTVPGAEMQRAQSLFASVNNTAATSSECATVIGWILPIWIDGGLWIPQVYDTPTVNENGELVIT